MNRSKRKNQHKKSQTNYSWYMLLIYGIVAQFIIVGFMGYIGDHFILGEYIPSEELLLDTAIMVGVIISVLITGAIRRKMIKISNLNFRAFKQKEQYCIIVISLIVMFFLEWVLACVNIMLIPVWALLKKISDWQSSMEMKRTEQHNQLMRTYVKEHIEQLPISHLCELDVLEKKRFLAVLQQNKQNLADRILHSMLSLGNRLGNNFIFLVMGSLLCLLVYEGELAIWEALLYLFSLNTLMSALNIVVKV